MTAKTNNLIKTLASLPSTLSRAIDWQLKVLPTLSASQRATYGLVNTDYLAYRFYEENNLEALLQSSSLKIAQDPSLMLKLASMLRTPAILEAIAGKLVRPDHTQKTDVPTFHLPRVQSVIASVLQAQDASITMSAHSVHPIVDVFTYLIGTPIGKAGMLAPSEGSWVARSQEDLVPTWEQVKGYALAAELRKIIMHAPVSDLIRDRQVMGALLLNPLVTTFKMLATSIINIHSRWTAFDTLGFLSAIFTLGVEQDYPEFKGLATHPEIVAFQNNFTLVELAVNRYQTDAASRATLSNGVISSATFSIQVQGLVTAMTTVPELAVVPLEAFVRNTSVAWIGTASRNLAGVVVAPRFTINSPRVDVSYIEPKLSAGEPGITMLPLKDLEALMSSAVAPVKRFVETDAIEFYNIFAEAILTNFEELGDDENRHIMGFRCTESYLKHQAAALATDVCYDRDGTITYVFSPNVQDYAYLLSDAQGHLKATQDPALVIAFASVQETSDALSTITRAANSWTIGDQHVPAHLRDLPFRGYMTTEGASAKVATFFLDKKNTLDQRDHYEIEFGQDKAKLDISFYELAMNQTSFFDSSERNVIFAHRQPMASTAAIEFVTMLVNLYAAMDNDGRESVAIALADYYADFMMNGTVQAFISGLRGKIAHSADTPTKRRARHAVLQQPAVAVRLNRAVITSLLLRSSFLDRETYDKFVGSELFKSKEFLSALRSRLPRLQDRM